MTEREPPVAVTSGPEPRPVPRLYRAPSVREDAVSAVLKSRPEDFVVDEHLRHGPTGEGPHRWLRVRKQGLDTLRVAKALRRGLNLPGTAIGYAGLKDRHARTTQWFSVALENQPEPDWATLLPEGCELLEVVPSQKKLRTGGVTGNRFELRLRELSGPTELVDERLASVRAGGMVNYFGSQRFGFDGANLSAALGLFRGERKVRDRSLRGIYWSAARAHLFNAVARRRVVDGNWNRGLPGDALMLDGSHSVFTVDAIDEETDARLAEGDLHPTGPLWGRAKKGGDLARSQVRALEAEVLADWPEFTAGLERAGLEMARRSLRVRVPGLEWSWEKASGQSELRIEVWLPAGSFATVLLEHAIDELKDLAGGAGS